jgi:hypothetical protein
MEVSIITSACNLFLLNLESLIASTARLFSVCNFIPCHVSINYAGSSPPPECSVVLRSGYQRDYVADVRGD